MTNSSVLPEAILQSNSILLSLFKRILGLFLITGSCNLTTILSSLLNGILSCINILTAFVVVFLTSIT